MVIAALRHLLGRDVRDVAPSPVGPVDVTAALARARVTHAGDEDVMAICDMLEGFMASFAEQHGVTAVPAVQPPVTHRVTPTVTPPVTHNGRALTGAERQQRYREKRKRMRDA